MTIPYILLFLMIIIYSVSLGKIFEKAGREKSIEGYIPIYNLVVWLKVLKKPVWWILFFFIPFVNLIIMIACHVETARLFGRYEVKDTLLTIFLPWYMIPALAFKEEYKVEAPTDWENKSDRERRSLHDHITLFCMAPIVGHLLLLIFTILGMAKRKEGKGTMEYEWTNAIGFAVVAATIIRTFFFEAFTIPTGSMEKTMRIGDYLFVNKIKYGARIPMHPVSFPFVHNRLPMSHIKSYTNWFAMDYHRLPGYGEMKRGDIMVFNWPIGDSVLLHNDVIAHDYYAIRRDHAFLNFIKQSNRQIGDPSNLEAFNSVAPKFINHARKHLNEGGNIYTAAQSPNGSITIANRIDQSGGLQTLVLDKKETYIKRCTGGPGDDFTIINGQIDINGEIQEMPEEAQFSYYIYYKPSAVVLSKTYMDENFGIYVGQTTGQHIDYDVLGTTNEGISVARITTIGSVVKELRQKKSIDSIVPQFEPRKNYTEYQVQYCPVFPNHPDFDWSRDNFGPLHIPEKGWKVDLTNKENQIIYRRAIEAYEGNEVVMREDGMHINGTLAADYTFKQNYYWMMGDNRHGSVDSRYWGFVPEDHIVGTASFIWMSKHPEKGWFSGGLRFDRVFSFVK